VVVVVVVALQLLRAGTSKGCSLQAKEHLSHAS